MGSLNTKLIAFSLQTFCCSLLISVTGETDNRLRKTTNGAILPSTSYNSPKKVAKSACTNMIFTLIWSRILSHEVMDRSNTCS